VNKVKNCCENCDLCERGDDDIGDPEGWVCTNRVLNYKKEQKMLQQMESEKYRARHKRCFIERACEPSVIILNKPKAEKEPPCST